MSDFVQHTDVTITLGGPPISIDTTGVDKTCGSTVQYWGVMNDHVMPPGSSWQAKWTYTDSDGNPHDTGWSSTYPPSVDLPSGTYDANLHLTMQLIGSSATVSVTGPVGEVADTCKLTLEDLNNIEPASGDDQNLIAGDGESAWGTAQAIGSPLVMDLSATGTGLTLSSLSTDPVYWDIASEGVKHLTGWITDTTGLLCLPNTDGTVTNNSNLFGNNGSTSANGFEALGALDSNSDGVIDSSDTRFGDLRVWVDSNHDGVAQASELHTLTDLSITSINLSYSAEDYEIAGNTIKQQSTFTMGGDTRTIADAWFAYDDVNTIYNGDLTISDDAAVLLTQRGYGLLPCLTISMSSDSTLLGQVQDLSSQSLSQLLDPSYHLETKLEAILYQWAGVESVDPELSWAYFGPQFDAQKLAFLEQLMDQPIGGTGDYTEVGSARVPYLEEAWEADFSFLAAHMLAQAGFSNLMGNPIYDLSTDTFSVSGSTYDVSVQFVDEAYYGTLSHLTTNDIFVLNAGDAPVDPVYGSPTVFINETASGGGTNTLLLAHISPSAVTMSDDAYGNLYVNYSSTDTVQINGGVVYGGGITVGDYVQQIAFDDGTIWSLTGGIHLTATTGYSHVYGTNVGGDILDAGSVTDATLTAYTGDNVFIAGPGAQFYGGDGTDSFVVNVDSAPASSGGVLISPNTSATADQVVLHGVTPSQVQMYDDYSGNLMITTSNGDLATVQGGSYDPWGGTGIHIGNVSEVVFDDSTVWDLTSVVTLTSGTGHGTLYGLSTGTNFVAGGIGGSSFEGYSVHDTFEFSSGSSPASGSGYLIEEHATGGTTTALLLHDVISTDITMSDDTGGDLMISTTNGDLVTIAGSYSSSTGVDVGNVNHVLLDDSSTIGLQGGLNLVAANDGQALYGTGHGDNMSALGTYDSFYGIAGNNTMTGGSGTTNYYGGSGNDVMIGGSGTNNMTMGTGADEIKVESATSTNSVSGFSIANGDSIHLEDVLTGYDPVHDALANFVQEATSGGNTTFSVDPTGSGTFTAGPLITLAGVTGLDDVATLVANGHLIVHS